MSDLKVEVVTFEKDGVLYHVENVLMGKTLNVRKSRLGNIHYNCPHCAGKNKFGMDDIRLAFSDVRGDKLFSVQQYAKVSSDLRSLEDAKDFISYLVKRAQCREKHLAATKYVRQRAEVTLRLKCLRCEKDASFGVSAEAKIKAPIPIEWISPEAELVSELAGEDLSQVYDLSDMDKPDALQRLLGAKELFQALEVRPLTWKGHDKLLWLMDWDQREKSMPECAEEFLQRVQNLRSDIEKAPIVVKGFVDIAEKQLLDAFKTSTARQTFTLFLSGFRIQDSFDNELLRRLRRQLAENLLWLNDEVSRLVTSGKLE